MQPFATQHSLFRAYDIRGDKQYFTAGFIQALGDAFFRLYTRNPTNYSHDKPATTNEFSSQYRAKETTVILGFDVRCGSECIAEALAERLQQQGLQVFYLGLITTPMMAFWTEQYNGHGIMVTASHSHRDILGIKWLYENASPSEAAIKALYQDLVCAAPREELTHLNIPVNNSPTVISLPTDAVAAPYIETIKRVFSDIYSHKYNHKNASQKNASPENSGHKRVAAKQSLKQKLDMTVVIDCMHGATSRIAAPLFTTFCQRVIIINDTPDGSFPMGNPDPTEANRLAELQQMVIVNQADIGLAFDGDGDRLMIVDDSGKVVMSDHLLYLLARVAITERPESRLHEIEPAHYNKSGDHSVNNNDIDARTDTNNERTPQVLFDVKCSHHLPVLLEALGAAPVMSRTGSGFMRERLRSYDSHIVFAGELSGHFIFNDGYFTAYDDAMYAGLRLLHWLAYTSDHNHTLSPAFDALGTPINLSDLYRLTDITSQLPDIVITSDHYLPMATEVSTECSIIKRLATHCHHLQRLVHTSISDNHSVDHNSEVEKNTSHPLTKCLDTCCLPYATTAQAQQLLPEGTQITCIDGVRLDFARGFGVLRQSNTSQSLTVRFAADSTTDLQNIQAQFVAICEWIDQDLAEQIAAIDPE
ncbi:phosphomannomutase [Psychrobacter sp. DM4]|uniref:phosphomannomutase n=1 Tax=Psychrobacter sp. DM4 TaxID=3440637 RepID=UPI003F50B8DF